MGVSPQFGPILQNLAKPCTNRPKLLKTMTFMDRQLLARPVKSHAK